MKRIIVFGGNGFIGSHVVDNLVTRGYNVTVFGRHVIKRKTLLGPEKPFRFFFGDVKDREAVLHAVSKHDGAINLAGILGTSETVDNPFPSVEVNIFGALHFFEACRTHKIPAVQIAVGNYFMNNPYAITKTTIERFALMYNKEHKTKIAIVRGLNAYGPRQKHAPVRKIIPNFIVSALQKKPIKIYGDGSQIMDMIYVKDLADVLVRSLVVDHEVYQGVFEAGTGIKTTVKRISQLVNKITDNKTKVQYLPMRAGEPEGAVVLGDPRTLKPLYARKLPELTSIEAGLKSTIAWYKKNYPWQDAN